MQRISFSAPASRELQSASSWYRRRLPERLHGFRNDVDATVAKIQEAPLRWGFWGPAGHRRILLAHFPFSIIYHIEDDTIVVDAIRHQARGPDRRFQSTP